jgi:hypothetical protein
MGINPNSKLYVPLDLTDKKYITNLFDIVLEGSQGVGNLDFWWLDWQQQHNTSIEVPNYFFFNTIFNKFYIQVRQTNKLGLKIDITLPKYSFTRTLNIFDNN